MEQNWNYILTFLSRTCWNRLWIIQELALNDNFTIVLCGNRQISRSTMQSFVGIHEEYLLVNQFALHLKAHGLSSYSQQYVFNLFYQLNVLLRTKRVTDEHDLLIRSRVLDMGQRAKCKDPRDHVYGLLGLLPSRISQSLVPDYNKPELEVYQDFAGVLLNVTGLTGLLSWSFFSEEHTKPSWLPDWKTEFPRNHIQWLIRRAAGQSASAEPIPFIVDGKLRCSGVIVDTICGLSSKVSQFLPYTAELARENGRNTDVNATNIDTPPPELSLKLQRTLLMDHPGQTLIPSTLPSQGRCEVQTLLGNIYWIDWCTRNRELAHGQFHTGDIWKDAMEDIIESPLFESFDRFRQTNAEFDVLGYPLCHFFPHMSMKSNKSFLGPSTDVEAIEGASSSEKLNGEQVLGNKLTRDDHHNMILTVIALQQRRLATTKTGHLALVPDNTNADDVIALLAGCNFPVVLRPATSHPATADSAAHDLPCASYRFAGECYVDGLMNGEGMKTADGNDRTLTNIILI